MTALMLPILPDGKDISQTTPPVLLNQFRLAGIPFIARKQTDNECWQQEVRVNGFVIGQALWISKQQGVISCQAEDRCAILYYALNGEVQFHASTGERMVLPAGYYGLLVCPAASVIELNTSDKHHHTIQLSFSIHLLQHLPGLGSNAFDEIPLSESHLVVYTPFLPVTKSIRSIWNQYLFSEKPAQRPDFLKLNEGCLKLLARFTTVWLMSRKQQRWRERKEIRIEELEAYLADHLDVESRPFTTEIACARKVGMSVSQFQKFWKKRSGLSLTQYLLRSRMGKARQLLLTKEWTPATVFLQVGYWNLSGFSRAFTAWYGFPPSRLKE